MESKKKKLIIEIVIALLVSLLAIFIIVTIRENNTLELNYIEVNNSTLPREFEGFKIAHVSDLHNRTWGENNERLINLLKSTNPDIIAITGDIVDKSRTNIEIALEFAIEATKIAPCYYVSGNHESAIPNYDELEKGLIDAGVTVLNNTKVEIKRAGGKITIMGICDPTLVIDEKEGYDEKSITNDLISKINYTKEDYTILLSHRPENFDIYAEKEIDLTLSGHAHGGQVRLPLIGGILAPNQGFFPKYDSGLYQEGTSAMVVSRGIGNSSFPIRVNNIPEVILIELTK
ncbi:MAG: metallophosphoesterase [Clostridia bacterium]|nr:metallophosphoesterase [Clostridia bacterium]